MAAKKRAAKSVAKKTSTGAGSRAHARSSRSAPRHPAPVEQLARVEPLPGEDQAHKLAHVEQLPDDAEAARRQLAQVEELPGGGF